MTGRRLEQEKNLSRSLSPAACDSWAVLWCWVQFSANASRAQPRPAGEPYLSLLDIQHPMIDACLEALPQARAPRILASRTVFVTDDPEEGAAAG